MREIKFRAWIKDYALMADVNFMNIDYKEIVVMIDENDYEFNCGEYELMQYTGLTDKNGTEIYEGDILSTDLSRPYLIVEFRNGAFMLQCQDSGKSYYDYFGTYGENLEFVEYHEVIGNIYEHPHLLGD